MQEIVHITKERFPQRLLEIPDVPETLYRIGELPPEEYKWLCVVGARRHSPYAEEVIEKLIGSLQGLPVVIVSGLALGVDALAHKAALKAGLPSVAVPGSGLSEEVLYPRTNRILAKEIIKAGGCLLSEFEPDFGATPWSFPQRNRVMAGLSDAVLIIEAELKSGTLITSKFATEYNRDVFAVPGSIFSSLSDGPHMLIRLGATPISSPDDLKRALGFENAVANIEKDLSELSGDEKKLYDLLTSPQNKSDLIRNSRMTASEANAALMMLEIKGLIKESLGEIRRA